jgi:acetyl esterase/lipase
MHRAHAAVAGVLAISGLFDLEPIRRGALNDALGLREQDVAVCSPQARIGRGVPTVVAVGGAELSELQRQSREYQAGLRDAGESSRLQEIPGANHLSILAELEGREGVLLAAALALIEQTRR